MSIYASGSVEMKMKEPVPDKIIELIKKTFGRLTRLTQNELDCSIEFEGNWRLDSVMDELGVLNPYVESGQISYWCDDGEEAIAEFRNGTWFEEWRETYYPSDLPNAEISSNGRVAEILNIIANGMMAGSDSREAIRLLIHECKLTDREIRYYGLGWLKDLDAEK